jgi:hypothetical protein
LRATRPTINDKRVHCWGGLSLNCGVNNESCPGCPVWQGQITLFSKKQQKLENNIQHPDIPDRLDSDISEDTKTGVNPSLAVSLNMVYDRLQLAEKMADGSVDEKTFYEVMGLDGWNQKHLESILNILERDKRIFRPRPGFLKCAEASY